MVYFFFTESVRCLAPGLDHHVTISISQGCLINEFSNNVQHCSLLFLNVPKIYPDSIPNYLMPNAVYMCFSIMGLVKHFLYYSAESVAPLYLVILFISPAPFPLSECEKFM